METRIEKYLGVNQLESLLSKQKFLELDWRPVPEIDGNHCKTRKDVGIQKDRCGLASLSSVEWAMEQLVITSQSSFNINHEFCKGLTTSKTMLAW